MNRALVAVRTACTVVMTATLLGLMLSGTASAKPAYAEVVISDAEDGDEMDAFAPNTAKIHVTADLVDVAVGSKVSSKWIAEKTGVAPPNFLIDSVAMTVAPKVNVAHFAISKPNSGWPVGEYRVELLINDSVVETVRFKVAK